MQLPRHIQLSLLLRSFPRIFYLLHFFIKAWAFLTTKQIFLEPSGNVLLIVVSIFAKIVKNGNFYVFASFSPFGSPFRLNFAGNHCKSCLHWSSHPIFTEKFESHEKRCHESLPSAWFHVCSRRSHHSFVQPLFCVKITVNPSWGVGLAKKHWKTSTTSVFSEEKRGDMPGSGPQK